MGNRDAAEMLEVAKAECLRLERQLARVNDLVKQWESNGFTDRTYRAYQFMTRIRKALRS